MTAQDLVFRGGLQFRKQPQVVLDVTEQVSGPTTGHACVAEPVPSDLTSSPPAAQPVPMGPWGHSLCTPGEADAGEFQNGGSPGE